MVMKLLAPLFLLLLIPLSVGAQEGPIDATDLGTLSKTLIDFMNNTVVPLIWAVAFIVFIYGVYNYFIAGGADEEKRSEGKKLVMWGVVAFFVMSSVWGLVNLLGGTFTFGDETTPDYPTFDVANPNSN